MIDLTTGLSRTITFPLDFYEGGMYDVAFIDNNTVLVDSTFRGSGWVPLRRVDLTTGAATTVGSVRMQTVINASDDRTVVGIAEGNSGPIGPKRYRVSDGNIAGSSSSLGFLSGIAASRNGQQYAVRSGSWYIFDENLKQIGVVGNSGNASPSGVAYSPTSDLMYIAWYDSSHVHPAIDVYDTNTLSEVAVVDFGTPFTSTGGTFGQGSLRTSNDGVLLSSIVSSGVKVYSVAPTSASEDWYKFTMVRRRIGDSIAQCRGKCRRHL